MNSSVRKGRDIEAFVRQRQQRLLFLLLKYEKRSFSGGAVNTQAGKGAAPLLRFMLCMITVFEFLSFEKVLTDVPDLVFQRYLFLPGAGLQPNR